MTRETKIGLLVGLAFIIVIGILLSDHLGSTEPPQAQLAGVGDTVRGGAAIPPPVNPPAMAIPPVVAAPHQPVPTNTDLNPQPAGSAIVQISPGTAAPVIQTPAVTENPAVTANNTQTQSAVITQSPETPTVTQTPSNVPQQLAIAAKQNGMEVVPVNSSEQLSGRAAINTAKPLPAGAKEYKADAGDTLSKIATKMYGTNSKAARDAIAAANTSLKGDPNRIIQGRTYVIPAVDGLNLAAAPSTQPVRALVATLSGATTRPSNSHATSQTQTYTVKDGDTLWQIASKQAGGASNVGLIKDLNKDVLKGSETVRAGMILKLPTKPTVTASVN